MVEKYFALLSDRFRERKKVVFFAVLCLMAVSGAGLYFVEYDGDIGMMLPPDPEISRSMSFLRESNFSDKVVVSLALTDDARNRKDLFQAVDQLAASLSPPLFTRINSGFSAAGMIDSLFSGYAPQILGEKELAAIEGRINPAYVSDRLQKLYLQSMKPESVFMVPMFRSDPMGINLLLLERMKALPASLGYDVSVEDGHFVSRDGRHAMMIIQTPVQMTDGPNSKKLLDALSEQLARLPDYVSAEVISGHRHTVSNEKVIKSDIRLLSVIVSIVFLVLFLVIFRDMRVVLVYIIPLLAVVLAINISYLFAGKMSYLVVGFGTAIAGISVDYGLMMYITARKNAGMPQRAKLAKLLFIDSITSAFGFLALYFSRIQGYHQLALFSILCILISLFFALFILPLVLSWKGGREISPLKPAAIFSKIAAHRNVIIAVWVFLTAGAALLSFGAEVESDIRELDGAEAEIKAAEQRFHEVWGGKSSQAIFVVTGKTFEDAMKTNDMVFQKAKESMGNRFSSLSMFWGSEETRRENVERWNNFWNDGREAQLRELIRREARPYGFTEDAFSPFFDNLYRADAAGDHGEFIGRVKERFVHERPDGCRILSFFPDKKELVSSMSSLAREYPGSFVVSGVALSESISRFTAKEAWFLVPLAIIFNIVLAYLFFRNVKETLIALIPVLTGMIWLSGSMALFGLPLNIVNIVAAIITSGVIVDYGIGITYDYRNNLTMGTPIVVSLSAATNIIGAGALLFADHPAFFSTGLAMVICMSAGYASAIFVVPALCARGSVTERQDTAA